MRIAALCASIVSLQLAAAAPKAIWPGPTQQSRTELSDLRVLHVNDVHAHLAGVGVDYGECQKGKPCYGGWARIAGKRKQIEDQDNIPTILLDAGDDGMGTAFFTDKGMKIVDIYLQKARVNAWTVGNHDFDRGEIELAQTVHQLEEHHIPTLGGNIKSKNHILATGLKRYVIHEKLGLVIMGVSTVSTKGTSEANPSTEFLPEIEEAQKILKEIKNDKDVQKIRNYRVIALTHIGFTNDEKLAKQTEGISLIVGGHSHTSMGKMVGQYKDEMSPTYPKVIKNAAGKDVCVVQAASFGRYLGQVDLSWKSGLSCKGQYHLLDDNVKPDREIEDLVQEWTNKKNGDTIGKALTKIDRVGWVGSPLGPAECLMGNFQADVILDAVQRHFPKDKISFALATPGLQRGVIDEGPVSLGLIKSFDYVQDKLVKWRLKGHEIWQLLEGVYSYQNTFGPKPTPMSDYVYLHFSKGIKSIYDRKAPKGERLKQLWIGEKEIKKDDEMAYNFGTVEWLLLGSENLYKPVKGYVTWPVDMQIAMRQYFEQHQAGVSVKREGRQKDLGAPAEWATKGVWVVD